MLSEIRHQEWATRFLERAISGTLLSPLLLIGPQGVGKRYSLLCMMREVLCTGTRAANCTCAACYQLQRSMHPDLHVVTGTKRIEVNDIRALIGEISTCPSASKFSAFIIDGADKFTIEAADCLLKTLEEPPATSRLFLLAENESLVPATIRSRCGRVVYRALPEAFIASIVQRHEQDPGKALVYSRMGEGSAGRAVDYCSAGKLSLRDQVVRVIHASVEKDLPAVFSLVDSMKNDLELAVLFTEQVLRDVVISGIDHRRVINVDLAGSLAGLRTRVVPQVWINSARRVCRLKSLLDRTHLNLGFQLKTVLAEAFV
jgi:DNA polymerase III subunit delta'